jgi:tripartite-type tricarboxylate transporter receptor subunit TctC
MLKFLIAAVSMLSLAQTVAAQETIVYRTPLDAKFDGNAGMIKVIEKANATQNKYNFVFAPTPGGQGVIALNTIDRAPGTEISMIHASYAQNSRDNLIKPENYVPIANILGEQCNVLVSREGNAKLGIKSLAQSKANLTFGTVGVGSAAHITAIAVSKYINRPVTAVPFKSRSEAALLLVGNHDLTMTLLSGRDYANIKDKNPTLKVLAASCPTRHPDFPNVQTFQEQGLNVPTVFTLVVANKLMPETKRNEIGKILTDAQYAIGSREIFALSNFQPPGRQVTPQEFYEQRLSIMHKYLTFYNDDIAKLRGK